MIAVLGTAHCGSHVDGAPTGVVDVTVAGSHVGGERTVRGWVRAERVAGDGLAVAVCEELRGEAPPSCVGAQVVVLGVPDARALEARVGPLERDQRTWWSARPLTVSGRLVRDGAEVVISVAGRSTAAPAAAP